MAQTGFTPILLYSSSTGGNAPAAADLTNNTTGSELAINITDGKLFYKDNTNAVQVIGWKTTPTTAGGTGLTSYTAGDLPYYASGTTLSKLGIGSSGQILTSTGTAPQWSTLSGVAVTTFSAGTTGLTPSSATSGAITLAGTLATTNGGTGLTSFTANGILYASSTSALTTGSGLTYNGTTLATTGGLTSVGATYLATTSSNKFGVGVSSIANGKYQIGAGGEGGITYNGVNNRPWYANGLNIGVGNSTSSSLFVNTGTYASDPTYNSGLGIDGTFDGGANSFIRILGLGVRFAGYYGNLTFSTNSGTTINECMRIYGSTGVSIGNTTDPGATNLSVTGYAGAASFRPTSSTIPTNGMYLPATNSVGIATNSTLRATIDASGNLGLGVTLSSWGTGSSVRALQLSSGSLWNFSTTSLNLMQNAYFNGTNYIYSTTAEASYYSQGAGTHKWYYAASGTAGNTVTFTQALTLNANGNLALQGGTTSASGVGVTFPATQSASTDANCLDDYEEGTWTPVISGNPTAGAATYTTQNGTYTKIGRSVSFSVNCAWSAHTGSGILKVSGLPFTSINSAGVVYTVTAFGNNFALTASNTMVAYITSNTTDITVQQIPVGGGALSNITLDTVAAINISGVYIV